MGFIGNLKNKGESKVKSFVKMKAIGLVAPIAIKIVVACLLAAIISTVFEWIIEVIVGGKTPEVTYEELGVEEMSELVEIVGNETDGYHLEFVDDIDTKMENLVNKLEKTSGLETLDEDDIDLIKDMIKAEVVTQFPNLGGKVDDSENQFQGASKIRRITPDKVVGEMDNPATGEGSTLDDLKVEDAEEDDEEFKAAKGDELKVLHRSDVFLKGTYDSDGSKTSEDGITKKTTVDVSGIDGMIKQDEIDIGDIVYYTGESFSDGKNTYVEVSKEKNDKLIGYIKRVNVKLNGTSSQDNKNQENDNDTSTGTKTIGDKDEEYVLAIAAGHNNTDNTGARYNGLVEEDLTIQVAEKVEELFKEYSNVKVVQTGSTSDNRGGVKLNERVALAKEANPDLCIQIHFNAGGGSGVETWYESGDGLSEALGTDLSESISKAMGLENRGAKCHSETSSYWAIIDSSHETGFPSIITEGGFIDNDTDRNVIQNGGIDKYAQGIVDGCAKFLSEDHDDVEVDFVEDKVTYSQIESRIYDLKYIPEDVFDSYIEQGKEETLEYYTLDESYNLITASWNVSNGAKTLKKNSPVNFRTVLQNITMPYEYLLFFLTNSGNKEFVQKLAEEVQKAEIIFAVQDNITCTQTNTTTYTKREIQGNYLAPGVELGWVQSGSSSSYTESWSTTIELTYVNSWCMEYSKGLLFSAETIGISKDEFVDVKINVKGEVTDETSSTTGAAQAVGGVQTGTITTGEGENKQTTTYKYQDYERQDSTTHKLIIKYDAGAEATISGKKAFFVKLYQDYKMRNQVKEEWLFQLLENNDRTANMVDLTKYLLYLASDKKDDYGVTEEQDVFNINDFINIGTGIYGNSTQEKIWWAVINAGYSKIAAAGVLGNIEAESGFNSTLVEYGYTEDNGGIGLCQWTNYPRSSGQGRNAQLKAYAASKGTQWQDENTQIEFLIAELTPGGNEFANYQLMSYHGYTPDDWKNSTTPEEAAETFCWIFERPGIPRMDVRTEAAVKYYNQFKDLEKPSDDDRIGDITLSGENAQKMQALLAEAVRIADDDRYTYSQANRYGEFQYDCSSLIARLYKQYFNFDAPSTTRGYGSAYYVGPDGSVELQPGDVLWKSGHVEMYIGNGLRVGAHTDQVPAPDQISIENYSPGYFTKVYRFITN